MLRALVHRIGSPRIGLCLADLKHASVEHLIAPALDSTVLFCVHDNLGGRWDRSAPGGLDPVRLDLHLPPGRGTLAWTEVAPLLRSHDAPLMLEIHAPLRPQPDELFASTEELLAPASVPAAA